MGKKNYKNVEYGNKDGTLRFGHLHLGDSENLESDVMSGVMLEAFDHRHYVSMENEGLRKGWTINRCPGVYEIKCATDTAGTDDPEEGIGFLLIAEKGDIVLRAPNGRIRLSAQDIHLRADGPDNTRGAILLDSNEAVKINTLKFQVKAKGGIKMFTPYSMDLIADTSMSFISTFLNGLSSASTYLSDKVYSESSDEYNTKSKYE
jgi:hypothetical protein